MLDCVYISDDNLIVRCQLLQVLWGVGASGTVRHYHHVAALLVHQVKHVCAHPLNLLPVDFEHLVGSLVLSGVSQLQNDNLPLLLVLDGV